MDIEPIPPEILRVGSNLFRPIVEKELMQAKTPLEAMIRLALLLYKEIDLWINIALRCIDVRCKAGCGACCRQQVLAYELEAVTAAVWILMQDRDFRRKTALKMRKFERKTRQLYGRYSKFNLESQEDVKAAEEYWDMNLLCPFLDDTNLCTIYPVRPKECRLHFSVKTSDEECSYITGKFGKKESLEILPARFVEAIFLKVCSPIIQGMSEDGAIWTIVFPLQTQLFLERLNAAGHLGDIKRFGKIFESQNAYPSGNRNMWENRVRSIFPHLEN